jgi:hypothetical protein
MPYRLEKITDVSGVRAASISGSEVFEAQFLERLNCNKIFSGYQPRQDTQKARRFGNYLSPSSGETDIMGTEIVPEMSCFLSILTRLVA